MGTRAPPPPKKAGGARDKAGADEGGGGAGAVSADDMAKAVDKAMEIGGIRVMLKDGGKSGRYEA